MNRDSDSPGGAGTGAPRATTAGSLLDWAAGSYKILPGGSAYCTGIVPYAAFEVVRVQLET